MSKNQLTGMAKKRKQYDDLSLFEKINLVHDADSLRSVSLAHLHNISPEMNNELESVTLNYSFLLSDAFKSMSSDFISYDKTDSDNSTEVNLIIARYTTILTLELLESGDYNKYVSQDQALTSTQVTRKKYNCKLAIERITDSIEFLNFNIDL